MKTGTVFLNVQGTQFGFVEQVYLERLMVNASTTMVHEIEGAVVTFPVTRMRLWAFLHGHGWVRKG